MWPLFNSTSHCISLTCPDQPNRIAVRCSNLGSFIGPIDDPNNRSAVNKPDCCSDECQRLPLRPGSP